MRCPSCACMFNKHKMEKSHGSLSLSLLYSLYTLFSKGLWKVDHHSALAQRPHWMQRSKVQWSVQRFNKSAYHLHEQINFQTHSILALTNVGHEMTGLFLSLSRPCFFQFQSTSPDDKWTDYKQTDSIGHFFFFFFTCRTRYLFLIVCCFQFNNLFASIQNVKIDFDRRKPILKERNKYCNHVWNLFNTNKLIAYAPAKPPAVNIDLIALHVFSQCPVAFPFVSF